MLNAKSWQHQRAHFLVVYKHIISAEAAPSLHQAMSSGFDRHWLVPYQQPNSCPLLRADCRMPCKSPLSWVPLDWVEI